MKTTYTVTMDDGIILDIRAENAGVSMFLALNRRRGHAITAIQAGRDPDPSLPLLLAETPGHVTFDIPPHKALPPEPGPGPHVLCASYVRPGDTVTHEMIDYRVERILNAEQKLLLETRRVRDGTQQTLAFMPDTLLDIVRPEALPEGDVRATPSKLHVRAGALR